MQVHQARLGPPVRFDPQTFTMSWPADQIPPRVPLVGHLKSGRLAYACDGSERRDWAGDVFVAVKPEHPRLTRCISADAEIAVIDLTLLSQVAATGPGRTRRPVRFTGRDPVSSPAAETWQTTYAYVRDTVLMYPGAESQSLIVSSAVRLLAAVTLATFPNDTFAG